MTDLSSEIEQEASTLTEQMRWVQAGALVLVFVIFLYILWEFYGQVGQSDEESEKAAQSLKDSNQELEKASQELAKAKQETDLILSTVRQGLMLVGRDLKIGSQYSKECAEIFRMESLAGHSFLGLMQRLLNEKLYNTTRDFLDLLFDSARKEKPILKVNPLDVVEVNFSNPLGGFITKYLGFNFRRILESGVVARVFVGVTDITQQVKLERELRETEVKKEKQMNFLLEILHANPPQVTDFIETARADLQQMTDTLRSEDFASAETGKLEDLHQRINKVFRSVHNIKGNASLLQLRHFEKLAQEFEAKLHELRSRPSLTSDDFLSVVIHQSKLREDLQELDEIHQKLGELGGPGLKLGAPRSSPSPPVETEDRLVSSIRGLASTLALKMGKVVKVESAGFDSSVFSDSDQVILRDVLIQLTRNSLAHSLETPQERQQSGKAREGLISIQPSFHPESGFQGFVFTDDGRGLDIKKIREQAVEHGMIESEHAESYDENSLAPLIFTPGFSTASSATTEAGQGMGMDIIKTKIVDERGGEITVDVDPGRRCAFGIFLPDQS